MGDSEIKNEVSEQNEPQKKAEKPAKKDKKKSGFQNLKAEFKRIVWPDKDAVVKESTAVIVVTVILGAVIALLDWVIKFGLDKILQIG